MADERDHPIDQIRARRGRDTVNIGVSPFDQTQAAGAVDSGETNPLGVDFRSPWLKDRVSLSLEAQIALMEQRASSRLSLVDLGYTNRSDIVPLRPGLFVRVEPTGGYRLVYHDRTGSP